MDSETYRLTELASIRFGEASSRRLEPSQAGNVRLIRMGDLRSEGTPNMVSATLIRIDKPREGHTLRQGDIICRTRGVRNFTTNILDKEPDMPTILAAPLIRLRVADPKRVHPGYLFWWINHPESQRFLNAKSEGSSVKMISKRVLQDLPVKLPSLRQQHLITEIASLALREQTLHHRLETLRSQYIHGLLGHLASTEELPSGDGLRNPTRAQRNYKEEYS